VTTAHAQTIPPPPTVAAPHVALIGNPNTGKSTLFNRLTGARQRVGNYPGVTVEKRYGTVALDGKLVDIVDLPGTYSLAAVSMDERIVLEVLMGHVQGTAQPDVVVCVVDATKVHRNLFLALQVADAGLPIVIALNFHDAAQELGIAIDAESLSRELGVPVIPTIAAKGEGVDQLRDAIAAQLKDRKPMQPVAWPRPVLEAIDAIRHGAESDASLPLERMQAMRLLFDEDSTMVDSLAWPLGMREACIREARQKCKDQGFDPISAESAIRYEYLTDVISRTVNNPAQRPRTKSESIDDLLTHRFWGLAIFVGVMFVVFWSIYSWAGPLMDVIDGGFGWLGEVAGGALDGMPTLQSLVVDGVIAGVGGVVIFLPQILILFFFLAMLEDTGYMARAAFLMDKLFSWCGLSGKSFVPMLSGYACAVPAVMGARTIEDPKGRLVTILITPLMSCSARLPVYVLLIGAFIEPKYGPAIASLTLFVMHFVGLAVGLPIAFVLSRFMLKMRPTPFLLEMPSYQVPTLRDVFWKMWERGREFLIRAGTVIFAFTIIIWALCYFPRSAQVEEQVTQQFLSSVSVQNVEPLDEDQQATLGQMIDGAYIEQSYLGRMGKAVQPVFAPAGFDWKITVGVIGSFPAREVIIATMGIVYNLGGDVDEEDDGLIDKLHAAKHADGSPVFTVPVALAIMVFFALCMQCGATVAVVGKETNWRWATIQFGYMTALAWLGAVLTYQIGSMIIA